MSLVHWFRIDKMAFDRIAKHVEFFTLIGSWEFDSIFQDIEFTVEESVLRYSLTFLSVDRKSTSILGILIA